MADQYTFVKKQRGIPKIWVLFSQSEGTLMAKSTKKIQSEGLRNAALNCAGVISSNLTAYSDINKTGSESKKSVWSYEAISLDVVLGNNNTQLGAFFSIITLLHDQGINKTKKFKN